MVAEREMNRTKGLLDRGGAFQPCVSRLATARFIKFRDHNGAAKALEKLGGEEIQGRTIRLSKADGR